MERIEKINKILTEIDNLTFSYLNCLWLISLTHKLYFELNFIEEKEKFKDEIKETIDKELRDLATFNEEKDLNRLFDNLKEVISWYKSKYWKD